MPITHASQVTTLTAGALIRPAIRRELYMLLSSGVTFVEDKYFLESTFIVTVPEQARGDYQRFLTLVEYNFTDKNFHQRVEKRVSRTFKKKLKAAGVEYSKHKASDGAVIYSYRTTQAIHDRF